MTVHSLARRVARVLSKPTNKIPAKPTLHGDYTVLSGRFGARSNMANKYLLDAVSLEKRFTALKMKT